MTMTRLIRITAIAFVALTGTALVLAQDVTYKSMPNTDFSKFKSYKWIAIQSVSKPDQITDTVITQALDAELSRKGLLKTLSDEADLFVSYQVAVDQATTWAPYSSGGSQWGYDMGTLGTESTFPMAVGTLRLDMYDRAAQQLVWRGVAVKTLDPKNSQEKKKENLAKAVEKLLKNYPPPGK
jgi:hypothetical protein